MCVMLALLDCDGCWTALTDLLGLARVNFINATQKMGRSAAGAAKRQKPHDGEGQEAPAAASCIPIDLFIIHPVCLGLSG